jgi:hypothetical protein
MENYWLPVTLARVKFVSCSARREHRRTDGWMNGWMDGWNLFVNEKIGDRFVDALRGFEIPGAICQLDDSLDCRQRRRGGKSGFHGSFAIPTSAK